MIFLHYSFMETEYFSLRWKKVKDCHYFVFVLCNPILRHASKLDVPFFQGKQAKRLFFRLNCFPRKGILYIYSLKSFGGSFLCRTYMRSLQKSWDAHKEGKKREKKRKVGNGGRGLTMEEGGYSWSGDLCASRVQLHERLPLQPVLRAAASSTTPFRPRVWAQFANTFLSFLILSAAATFVATAAASRTESSCCKTNRRNLAMKTKATANICNAVAQLDRGIPSFPRKYALLCSKWHIEFFPRLNWVFSDKLIKFGACKLEPLFAFSHVTSDLLRVLLLFSTKKFLRKTG